MSLNKVEIYNHSTGLPFNLREGETVKYASSGPRQSFHVGSKEAQGPVKINISVANGRIFVTSQRFLYVTEDQGDVESFSFEFSSAPACQFSHALKSPWFGPNHWSFLFYSPSNATCDGFPKDEWFQGKLTFKDGGLFDFVAAVDSGLNDFVNNPHIDADLPRYSEA